MKKNQNTLMNLATKLKGSPRNQYDFIVQNRPKIVNSSNYNFLQVHAYS